MAAPNATEVRPQFRTLRLTSVDRNVFIVFSRTEVRELEKNFHDIFRQESDSWFLNDKVLSLRVRGLTIGVLG